MAGQIIADYHVHSLASDGNWRPSQVVREARNRGLEAIALTDHNTIYGLSEALAEAARIGLKFDSGIEIAAKYEGDDLVLKNIEILGLGFSLPLIRGFAEKLDIQRLQTLETIAARFNEFITQEDFSKNNSNRQYPLKSPSVIAAGEMVAWKCKWNHYFNPSPVFSNTEIMFYLFERFAPQVRLIEKTLAGNKRALQEAMAEYFFLFEVPVELPTYAKAIKKIKDSGGFAILAHPGRSSHYQESMLTREWESDEKNWFSFKNNSPSLFVLSLKRAGLDGIELYFYQGNDEKHGPMQERINHYFKSLAEQLGLIVTYGSDCHGPRGRIPYLGLFGSEKLVL